MTRKAPALRVTEASDPESHRINADLLIPGRGEPIKNGALVYKDGKITYAGAQKDVPVEFNSLRSTKVPVLMPGLWDCHVRPLPSN